MEQGALSNFYFKSEKTSTELYQNQKHFYGNDFAVHKTSEVLWGF